MNKLYAYLPVFSRVLLALIFVLNGFGIISPAMAIHDMVLRGISPQTASLLSVFGRVIDVVAGIGFVVNRYRQLCALALFGFLIPATLIAHAFWSAPPAMYTPQLVNFLKNVAIMGGLLIFACPQPFEISGLSPVENKR